MGGVWGLGRLCRYQIVTCHVSYHTNPELRLSECFTVLEAQSGRYGWLPQATILAGRQGFCAEQRPEYVSELHGQVQHPAARLATVDLP